MKHFTTRAEQEAVEYNARMAAAASRRRENMKLEIHSTEKLTEIDGVPVRLWEGKTESGIPCKVFVHRIAVHKEHDAAQFEAELKEQLQPGVKFDLRHVL